MRCWRSRAGLGSLDIGCETALPAQLKIGSAAPELSRGGPPGPRTAHRDRPPRPPKAQRTNARTHERPNAQTPNAHRDNRRAGVTLDELRERMQEAAYTLRRLPMPSRGLPTQFKTTWPDTAYEWLAYGWTPTRAPRMPPTPQEVTKLDECLTLLHLLTRDQRMILWARANKWTWRKIEALDEMERNGHGRTEQWLRKILGDAEARILSEVNGTPRRMILTPEQVIWRQTIGSLKCHLVTSQTTMTTAPISQPNTKASNTVSAADTVTHPRSCRRIRPR